MMRSIKTIIPVLLLISFLNCCGSDILIRINEDPESYNWDTIIQEKLDVFYSEYKSRDIGGYEAWHIMHQYLIDERDNTVFVLAEEKHMEDGEPGISLLRIDDNGELVGVAGVTRTIGLCISINCLQYETKMIVFGDYRKKMFDGETYIDVNPVGMAFVSDDGAVFKHEFIEEDTYLFILYEIPNLKQVFVYDDSDVPLRVIEPEELLSYIYQMD